MDAEDNMLIVGLDYTVEASGFLPDSTIEVELHSDPWSFGTWIANAYGRINAQIRLSPTTVQGQHRLVVREHISPTQATIRSALRTEIPVVVTVDETGPIFISASVSADSVDVANGAQTIDLSFTATDDLSGVAVVNIDLSGDAGWSKTVAIEGTCSGCALAYLTSGTIQDGTWTATVEIPGNLPSQTVAVSLNPPIRDAALNYTQGDATQVATFNITNSTPDTLGPVFGSASVSADSVDVTNGAQTIDLSFTATDDLSGVAVVNIDLSGDAGWSKTVAIEGTCSGCALAYLTSGTIQDGTWTATVEIPGNLPSQTVAVSLNPPIRDAALNYTQGDATQVATFNITNSGG